MGVKVFPNEETYKCSCLIFEQYEILCMHILCVMKSNFVKNIPSKYMLRRWQKIIIRPDELIKTHGIVDNIRGCERMIQDAYSIVRECINVIRHDVEAMTQFLQWKKEILTKVESNPPKKYNRTKNQKLDSMIGVSKLYVPTIKNPKDISYKGWATKTRVKS
uniref:SWIM-type domain-containing protein n=1 Tax=Lactuca sativa TaxID=4236 RepID=A0A9R1WKP2_LACSA|nr:hypothetical protein LSAT_V11C100036720 [Lactuca sativa]